MSEKKLILLNVAEEMDQDEVDELAKRLSAIPDYHFLVMGTGLAVIDRETFVQTIKEITQRVMSDVDKRQAKVLKTED